MIRMLLAHHADPNLRDKNGTTPLNAAMVFQDRKPVEMLRKAGARTGRELSSQPTTPQKR